MQMKLSPSGVTLLIAMEGKRNVWYFCSANKKTIGVGHVILSHEKEELMAGPISEERIMELLRGDLDRFERGVMDVCRKGGMIPTQTQFDAFVLLAFNIGMGGGEVPGFITSTVLRRFLNHDDAGAAAAFLMWNKITIKDDEGKDRKVISKALEARRMAESRLFLQGYYDETPYNALDDEEKLKALLISSNTDDRPDSIVPSEAEIRPSLKSSRTMKASAAGQAGSGLAGTAATLGLIKTVADGTKEAADSAGEAARSVTEAAEAGGEAVGLLSNLSLWIYGLIGLGALIAIFAFIAVRRARRDDWRRGLR